VVGTMIILNLFIGIIMNSMAEMHAEIAEGARALQEQEGGPALIEDEFKAAERQLKELQEQLAVLRHRCSSRD
jgi:voltage-gated sodium channel